MSEWLSTASSRYRDLLKVIPEGWSASERLVDPQLYIVRADGRFEMMLCGTKLVQGAQMSWPALSLQHDWVLDGKLLRPLPHDTPEHVRIILNGSDPKNLRFSDVLALLRLRDPVIPIMADDSIFVSATDASKALDGDINIPGLAATLYPYQSRGVSWMLQTLKLTGGLILADEMGLGKTIQVLALLLSERPSLQAPALIVCPTSLLTNWRQEILRFAPELSLMIHRGANRTGVHSGLQRAQIILATYDTVVNDQTIFSAFEWCWLICDEAQALKNPDSGRRRAISSIPRRYSIQMTGTPVETSLLDLWSLADLAIPGLLGDRAVFESAYPDSEESARLLAKLTNPIVLRRKVKDVAGDLPQRIDIDVPLEMGEQLTDRYNRVLSDTLYQYPTAGALVATGQLQLFCAHPWLRGAAVIDGNEDASLESIEELPLVTPKIERTISILEEAFSQGKKVLLFAIFNRCGELIRRAGAKLPDAYWGAINGSTPQEDRQSIVDQFSAHSGPACLVLNPKAAGAGLNITAATIVIHYTQAWNPALEAQASARAHRRGQTEPVYIYRLFYEGTVERVMIDRAAWRREMGNEAVPISTRDADDLRRALSINPKE